MSIDVLNRLLVASEWAEQVSNRGGIPSRVREAAQGQSYSISQARAAVAELIAACDELMSHRFGELPYQGWLRDNDRSRASIGALAEALASCKESSHG